MKFPQSIKWRLQLWYGLILVLVLFGFGVTAYQLQRGRQLGHIDNELNRRFDALAKAMHGPRGQRDESRFEHPPGGQFPEDNQPPDRDFNSPPGFNLPPPAANLFDAGNPGAFYFIIRGRDGKELARSADAPAEAVELDRFFARATLADEHSRLPTRPPPLESFGSERFIVRRLPSGEIILTGGSIATELSELKATAVEFTAAGAIILFLGLAGGWWFVAHALRPIETISAAAVKIAAGDLAQRINVAETESELGQLAAVLNSTFARLETAFAQQKQFAADAAHELRTPVAVMLTQTQTTLARERDAAGYKQTVEACQRAAQRMRRLIESLLELARFDAGQEVLARRPFDFSQTVADSVELVRTLAEERRVTLRSELTALTLTGDAERLAQVVTNLLTNAIQYNRADGEVRVKLSAEKNLAVLTIADTGQGIAAKDLPRVFERFYRADTSRTGAGNAGLGLSICQAIITAHGGTIEVASEEGAGTTFTVRLPI